jgi:predicted amino acid racemase
VGHLANVPENEIDYVLRVARPEVITVFNYEKAKMVSDRVEKLGLEKQKLLVRPTGKDDVQYAYMEGGPPEERALEEIVRINALPNVRVAGVTSFPCMLFDLEYAEPTFTPNMATLLRVAERARNKGIELPMINSPPLTTTATIPLYAAKGSTHLEPGQGVSGMSIYQVLAPERHREVPAVVHVTEVSHFFGEHAYVYGGGFGYIELYELSRGGKNYVPDLARAKLRALVGREPKALNPVDAVPYRGMIDYHAKIARVPGVRVGDTAVFAFRTQMFVTRAQVAVVAGLSENATKLVGLFDQAQNLIDRHGHLQGERATMDLIEKYSHSDLA